MHEHYTPHCIYTKAIDLPLVSDPVISSSLTCTLRWHWAVVLFFSLPCWKTHDLQGTLTAIPVNESPVIAIKDLSVPLHRVSRRPELQLNQ